MVKIRLTRFGRKNRPFFRICVYNSTTRRDGPYLENLGQYDPTVKESQNKVKIKVERYKFWVSKGAQPSEALGRILKHTKALQ